jgi:hypothetical protein
MPSSLKAMGAGFALSIVILSLATVASAGPKEDVAAAASIGTAAECARHAIEHIAVCHPSRRGYANEKNATEIADAIGALGFGRAVKENPSTG